MRALRDSREDLTMLTDRAAWLSALLLRRQGLSADRHTLRGSLTIAAESPSSPVGATVVDSRGLEEGIMEQALPLTVPVSVEVDNGNLSGRALGGGGDTLLTLTNTTSRPFNNITLTLRDAGRAATLASKTISLDAHATVVLFLSDLLPD